MKWSWRKRLTCLLLALLLCAMAACSKNVPSTPVSSPEDVPSPLPSVQPEPEPEQAEPLPPIVMEPVIVPMAPEEAEEPENSEIAPEEQIEPDPWLWPTDTPEHQGLRADVLPDIHALYDSFPLLSAMIIKNGYVVDTYYKDGYDADSRFVLNSASKSVTSVLAGIAIDQGYIESVDDLLSDYLPQVEALQPDGWQRITLRHLLTHTSAIASTDDALWYEWRRSENWLDYIFALPIVSEPGTAFSYSTGNTHLLSAALEAATGMSLYDFGKEYLFDPMDMDSVSIDKDPQGVSDGGNGIWMTTADMAKIGKLYLDRGLWRGERLVPEVWVEQSTTTQFAPGGGRADYGFQWWVRTFGSAAYPAYFAQGHAGQYIIVVPQLALILAFNSDYEGATSVYWQITNTIVDACVSNAADADYFARLDGHSQE